MTELPDHLFDDLQSRVKAGAEFLDIHKPDWREKVDPSALEMFLCHRCVLGQLFADVAHELGWGNGFSYGVCEFLSDDNVRLAEKELGFDIPTAYAFDIDLKPWSNCAWQTLNDLWVKEIQR